MSWRWKDRVWTRHSSHMPHLNDPPEMLVADPTRAQSQVSSSNDKAMFSQFWELKPSRLSPMAWSTKLARYQSHP